MLRHYFVRAKLPRFGALPGDVCCNTFRNSSCEYFRKRNPNRPPIKSGTSVTTRPQLPELPFETAMSTDTYSNRQRDETRCFGTGSAVYEAYHDEEWGVPIHDDRHLFELLILEGAQAGLSWETILKRRPTYRIAFDNFDVQKVAAYGPEKIAALLEDEGIIRNRLKVNAAIKNASAVLEIQREFGSLDAYLWSYVDGKPLQPDWPSIGDIPATDSPESIALSKDLKKRGMTFVGPTIMYAFMESTGMVNDHQVTCFRHEFVKKLSAG